MWTLGSFCTLLQKQLEQLKLFEPRRDEYSIICIYVSYNSLTRGPQTKTFLIILVIYCMRST